MLIIARKGFFTISPLLLAILALVTLSLSVHIEWRSNDVLKNQETRIVNEKVNEVEAIKKVTVEEADSILTVKQMLDEILL